MKKLKLGKANIKPMETKELNKVLGGYTAPTTAPIGDSLSASASASASFSWGYTETDIEIEVEGEVEV
ncbi:hypothetical protein [Deminuibacter soli]|uniref:Uncharacterized protein n=1 Tax=Deminuibacter soli TaxID=2291815 RepID=A0A3E1NFX9_9BACT|nr:hypothetical protein [Deminuibacter soli]RFM26698.1 hypothetical protein DXN05_19210 [Deminuibacter soli]